MGKIRKPRLNRADWIKAAFRALTEGGPQAIKAEAIARDLNVSKGSFYWHFRDVAALQHAMIDHWLEAGTRQVIGTLGQADLPPRRRLARLVELSTSADVGPYGGSGVGVAIRDWARGGGFVQVAVERVDCQRLEYVEKGFREAGADEKQARLSSAILYAVLIGLEQMSHGSGVTPACALRATLDLLLADLPPDP